jgi:DNA mismatch endonuclease, patch repair protein
MRNNKSKGNISTEMKLISTMKAAGIKGWRRGAKLEGRPDFVFFEARLVVFVDGCYWHGCKCKGLPKTNTRFWEAKRLRNRARDRMVSLLLTRKNWKVLRVWEHQLRKTPARVVKMIEKALNIR